MLANASGKCRCGIGVVGASRDGTSDLNYPQVDPDPTTITDRRLVELGRRAAALDDVQIAHRGRHASCVVGLLRCRLIAIGEPALGIEGETTVAVAGEEPYLLTRKECCRVDEVANGQWPGAAGQAVVENYLNGHHLLRITNLRSEGQAVANVERLAAPAFLEIRTAVDLG